ncbi:MAG TPA: S1 RNA-binding domain-containing protein, partial [bacterium]|nr:S1 RNA-binding domain-containing protein [bacterium]
MNTEPRSKTTPAGGEEDFATLLEKSYIGKSELIAEGEIVKGKVIDITHDSVIVDFGFKSEGQVPLHEFA